MAKGRERYGIDAPGVVRMLALVGLVLIAGAIAAPYLNVRPDWVRPVRPTALATGVALLAMAVWMMASSLWLKHRLVAALLDERRWRGDELVLDVGCGRGLVAVGVARRLTGRGRVHGLDLWSARDLSDNTPSRAIANARAAGVAERLSIDTGDMRDMPYPDAMFDVIASTTAIHNIEAADGRATAVDEMWRVLKPGGQLLVFDIRHARDYARQLRALGAQDVRLSGPILLWGVLGWRFSAEKPADGEGAASQIPGRAKLVEGMPLSSGPVGEEGGDSIDAAGAEG